MPANAIFNSEDMKEIYKNSMEECSWMNKETANEYQKLSQSGQRGDGQRAQQMRRQAFGAFQFHVIGNKHLLLAAIQHPVFSAAQSDADCSSNNAEQPAAMLQQFMDDWEEEKTSEAYKQIRQISKKSTDHRDALKPAAHESRRNFKLGQQINIAIKKRSESGRT